MRLAAWLEEQGRVDDAVEVLRPFAAEAWVLAELLSRHGRADEALAVIDGLAAHDGGMGSERHLARNALLVRCGRTEQAIAELRDRPDTSTWDIASRLADLLVDAGRPQEAGPVLDAVDRTGLSVEERAMLLIRQGRATEAVDLFAGIAADQAAKQAAADRAKDELDAAFWRRFRGGCDQPPGPAPRAASQSR